jgi:MtN3 and saliva related transmembrane protein
VSPVRLFRRNRGAAAAPKNHPSRVTELLGWLSSAILVATIAKQVYKQFTVYSALVGNPVFVVTNAMLLASAVTGLVIVLRHRRRSRRAGTSPSVPRPVRTA